MPYPTRPYPGRNHDVKMYRESDLSTIIRNVNAFESIQFLETAPMDVTMC
ncbi:hypothetical protein F443_13331 [Phytophthora nicotianae P1569]|uniref:Uncharacterized protein n=1 Tax=Phytophthora nicotianae P1569 TaxID=1317065 RepID=V9ESI1_PHYNI|nr:hypothetical protein F443_13331 [Phytophthora nicotianae P1569]